MTYTCPKDQTHASEDADFCSICGAKITAGSAIVPPAAVFAPNTPLQTQPSVGTGEVCPDCGTERPPRAKFCEVCRYNFESGASGGLSPALAATPEILSRPPSAENVPLPSIMEALAGFPDSSLLNKPAASGTSTIPPPTISPVTPLTGSRWEVIAVIDPSLYVDPDPAMPLPTDEPTRTFPLDFAENLIGRRSDRRDIHPEIPLRDPGISHRHAKILREPDGSFSLLDVGSTNGTEINGTRVAEGVRTSLQEGDQITLGCWTRLTVQKVA